MRLASGNLLCDKFNVCLIKIKLILFQNQGIEAYMTITISVTNN